MSAWEPGTVAMVDYSHADGGLAVRVGGGCVTPGHSAGPHWHFASGAHGTGDGAYRVRPLVVLDPEHEAQVVALTDALVAEEVLDTEWTQLVQRHRVQAALRSLVQPPKPEEPQGLGAVVEDEQGDQWVHFGNHCWIKTVPNAALRHTSWSELAAVKVLSEGVQ